ncbi:PAQR family membrane homeostasis protein TrhA [Haematobacter genomosp. 1]|nr:hemolysin III family protein [Haematobacter genomosp. 1]
MPQMTESAPSDLPSDLPGGVPRLRPRRDELIADGVVHGVGVALALLGTVVLVVSASDAGWSGQAAAALYGAILVVALSVSLAYNLWPEGAVKLVLRRFDHSSIFLLIAATYTPFLERSASHYSALVMLCAIWLMAIAGVASKWIFPVGYGWLSLILYLSMGWSGLLIAAPVMQSIPVLSQVLILAGGLVYSLGVIFFLWEKLRFQTAIWHGFVVTAAAMHYAAILACFR